MLETVSGSTTQDNNSPLVLSNKDEGFLRSLDGQEMGRMFVSGSLNTKGASARAFLKRGGTTATGKAWGAEVGAYVKQEWGEAVDYGVAFRVGVKWG